jgi:hypothetical protein
MQHCIPNRLTHIANFLCVYIILAPKLYGETRLGCQAVDQLEVETVKYWLSWREMCSSSERLV